MTNSYQTSQGSGNITIESSGGGFTQNSSNRYYLFSGAGSGADRFDITFSDGASIYLTDFSEAGFGSSSNDNTIGIPSTSATGFNQSINLIGGH